MRRLFFCAMALLVALAGTTLIMLTSGAPASAAASCTGASLYLNTKNEQVEIPTIGDNTHQDDCELGYGNVSNAVYWLQFDLNQCYRQHLTLDKIYGTQTQLAVEVAQRAANIPDDGIYGPQTRDHIKWVNYGGGGAGACFPLP
jgi:peptidoglycan hydrolase-like protein with peptidoglycan-binding domain